MSIDTDKEHGSTEPITYGKASSSNELPDSLPDNAESYPLSSKDCFIEKETLVENPSTLSPCEGLLNQIDDLNDSINSMKQTYVEENSNLIDAINSIPEGSYPLEITAGVIGALVAAFAVFVFNSIYFKKINAINKKAHYANTTLKLIEYFEETSTNYWISERVKDQRRKNVNNKEMKLLEIKIKSEFLVMRISLERFCELLPSNDSSDSKKISSSVDELYELATGGEFESEDKKSSVKVTKEIAKKCAFLKALMIQHSHHIN